MFVSSLLLLLMQHSVLNAVFCEKETLVNIWKLSLISIWKTMITNIKNMLFIPKALWDYNQSQAHLLSQRGGHLYLLGPPLCWITAVYFITLLFNKWMCVSIKENWNEKKPAVHLLFHLRVGSMLSNNIFGKMLRLQTSHQDLSKKK